MNFIRRSFCTRFVVMLSLFSGLALPNLAAADSATLCVDGKTGSPKTVIFSGSCSAKKIAVPLSGGGGPTFIYKIGDTGPGGGIVFFVDYNDQYPGFDYLEAAPEDVPGGPFVWGCYGTSVTDAAGWEANAVGRGQANTQAIIAANCGGAAAQAAENYTGGDKTDWFLPSEGELMLMYTNLRQAGKGAFGYASYWSSTESAPLNAWVQTFGDGDQNFTIKYLPVSVRPVRAF